MTNRTWEEINKDITAWDQRQHQLRVEQWHIALKSPPIASLQASIKSDRE